MNSAENAVTAPSNDAVLTGTSELWRAADKDDSATPLWGLDRDEKEVAPSWRL
jgi:hypothetical protein